MHHGPAELGNYNHVNTYVAKGEQSQDAKDPIVAAKLKCAAGLAALDAKKYKLAAKKFSEVGNSMRLTVLLQASHHCMSAEVAVEPFVCKGLMPLSSK